jgi:hypothetical protein
MTAILGEIMPLAEFKGKRLPLEKPLHEHNLLPDPAHVVAIAGFFKE